MKARKVRQIKVRQIRDKKTKLNQLYEMHYLS